MGDLSVPWRGIQVEPAAAMADRLKVAERDNWLVEEGGGNHVQRRVQRLLGVPFASRLPLTLWENVESGISSDL